MPVTSSYDWMNKYKSINAKMMTAMRKDFNSEYVLVLVAAFLKEVVENDDVGLLSSCQGIMFCDFQTANRPTP